MPFIHLINGMGQFSFWDPYRNGGYPIMGNAEHFFALSWLIDPYTPLANLWLNVALYLHLLAVAVVAWLVAKRAKLSPFWSAVAAISIGFSEILIVLEQSARFQALTLLLVLLLVHFIMQGKWKKKLRLALLSVLTAVALVSNTYYALFVLIVVLSYDIFDTSKGENISWSHISRAFLFTTLIGFLGLLISAPFTYPLFYHTKQSFVSVAGLIYPPNIADNIANLVIPSISKDRIFVSSLVAMAIMMLATHRLPRDLIKELTQHTLPIAALFLFSLFCLPLVGEIFAQFYSKLPVVSGLRHHSGYIIAALPSLVLVSCKILQHYESCSISSLSSKFGVSFGIFLLFYAFSVGFGMHKILPSTHFFWGYSAILAAALLGFFCILNKWFPKIRDIITMRHLAILLLIFGMMLTVPHAFAERHPWNKRNLHVTNKPSDSIFFEDIHKDDTPFFRIYREQGADPIFNILQGYERSDGFSLLFPSGWAYSLALLSSSHDLSPIRPHWVKKVSCAEVDQRALDFLGVKYMICRAANLPDLPSGWLEASRGKKYVLLERETFINPIRFYRNWRVAEMLPPQDSRVNILSSFINDEVLLDAEPSDFGKERTNSHFAKARKTEVSLLRADPGEFELQVYSQSSGILVIPENWDEGWQLTINGEKKQTVRAFMAYLGVPLQPGVSRIYIQYRDRPFLIGLFVSVVTLVFLLGVSIPNSMRWCQHK
jgi:hypothetical protein